MPCGRASSTTQSLLAKVKGEDGEDKDDEEDDGNDDDDNNYYAEKIHAFQAKPVMIVLQKYDEKNRG